MITADEFLTGYAERSGVTPESLLAEGKVVATCQCDYESCEGWQLTDPKYVLPWRGDKITITEETYNQRVV